MPGFLLKDPKTIARGAGLAYLVVIVFGLWSEFGIRAALIVSDDPVETASAILTSEELFRLSIVADLLVAVADVVIAVLLYALLQPVSWLMALTAMVFRIINAAIIAANLLHLLTALLLIHHGVLLPAADANSWNAMATIAVDIHHKGYGLALAFFGVSCLVTGLLVYRSGLFPKLLGAGLVLDGFIYLTGCGLALLAPALIPWFMPAIGLAIIIEVGFCLWLLVRGVDAEAWRRFDISSG